MVVDNRPERLSRVQKTYPDVTCALNPDVVFADKSIDAVVIATPVSSHHPLAKKALENGKHVLLEKPMTSSLPEGMELLNIANKRGLVLMVDHTFLYTSAVQKIKKITESEGFGRLKYLDSTRINLGLFQSDVNVLWDLAPHDISILLYLLDERPITVNATGVCHTNNGHENIAYLTMNYESGFIAHINCSWSSPVKIRMMLIGGTEKMIVYNDLEPTEKIKLYDTAYQVKTDEDKNRMLVDYRVGDVFIPKLANAEALFLMASDFTKCIRENTIPMSNAQLGLDVVKILSASTESIKNNGKQISFAR
jgi:predicted dehydrogenase